jgi:hypothetical protein
MHRRATVQPGDELFDELLDDERSKILCMASLSARAASTTDPTSI